MSLRRLGTFGMLAAPMLLLEMILFGMLYPEGNRDNRIVGVLEVIYVGGWMCSAIGMRRLRVAGEGVLGKTIFVVQMTGLLLALAFAVHGIVRANPDPNTLFFKITDAAWPLSHLFMLVVGGFVIYAGVWRGWRRFAPLLCGLALPAFFAANAVFGTAAGGVPFGVLTAIAFMLLGYAVRTSQPRHV